MQIKGVGLLKRFKINAIVIYPFVIYADRKIDPVILKHEAIHVQQIKRDGILFFYFRYLKEYFAARREGMSHHQAYHNISYEVEAYQHQRDFDYHIPQKSRPS